MKLHEVPEHFRSQYVLQPEQLETQRFGFLFPKNDCHGHAMPRGQLRIKGAYPNDIVKLKSENGEEFIVRRTEVMTKHSREIVYEWLLEEFRKSLEPAMIAKDKTEAANALRIPIVALWMKLSKAKRLGLPVPSWFNK